MEQRSSSSMGRDQIPAGSSSSSDPEGCGLLMHLLEYKAHLLEAVEELHIRRDAETRFEDQISKVVLEKQELEWEKESLQHQTKTAAHQHAESLAKVKKQLQERIRSTEEEKEKFQVAAELKEKEVTNLKEELKMLQLLKYNLEKKSSELEQKLTLQVRSKETHLSQVGELEKRFNALSRQCAVFKLAHGTLEQKVDEAMMINKKLTSANEKQQATVLSLTEELEDLNSRLIKTRTSSFQHDSSHSSTLSQQQMQQLQLKMNQQAEVNKTLREENLLIRAEKQEVMKAMQQTQQLLLTQTQTVCRLEQELQVQEELYQALQLEHELARERSRVTEEKMAKLTETCSSAQTARECEKEKFLSHISREQQDLREVKEAYDDLQHRHCQLTKKVNVQAQHINQLQTRDFSGSLWLPTLTDVSVAPLDEPSSSSGGTQTFVLCLDTSTSAKLASAGATEDQTQRTGSVKQIVVAECCQSICSNSEPSDQEASNQHQTLPDEVSSPSKSDNSQVEMCNVCEHTDDNNNTSATGLEVKSTEAVVDKDLRASVLGEDVEGHEGKNRKQNAAVAGECLMDEGEKQSEERRQGKDVAAAAQTRDMTLTQTTDRAAAEEDSDAGSRDPQTQTNDREEGTSERGEVGREKTETQTAANIQSDPLKVVGVTRPEDACEVSDEASEQRETSEPTNHSIDSHTNHDVSDTAQTCVSDSAQRMEDESHPPVHEMQKTSETLTTQIETSLEWPEHSKTHGNLQSGSGSDVFTDPGSATSHSLTDTEDFSLPRTKACWLDWSLDKNRPTVASLQCLQDSRSSLPVTSHCVSSSAHTGPALTSSGGAPGLESASDLSCSQEREAQQSTLRAQISKIEQFLSAERLRLLKRRRTDE